jgi:prolyl-tRNA editing enzyme YbaK/EbsC (Cys-tRNA(Pro) deacylase)
MHERAADFAARAAAEIDVEVDVHEFPEGTKTAADAAEAIGCDVAQIASSLAFVADDQLVVVVTSGANRVDESRLAEIHDVDPSAVRMAEPDEVKTTLGWSIGGVPPFLHETDVPVSLDETLTDFETVWAAAGTPAAVFPIAPGRLQRLAEAEVERIAT